MNITIIGAGKLGIKLAESLVEENHNVTVVDINESKVNKIVESYDVQGVYGSATQCEVLRESDIKSCDLLIATTPSDENNILSCLIGRRMGAKNTISRVRNPEYSAQINFMRDELGISMMINPDFAAALEVFKILQFPSVVNVESFANGNIDIVGIKVKKESSVCGKKVSELSSKNKFIICAVSRGEDVYIPNGEFVLREGDMIHISGSHYSLGKIARELSAKKTTSIKNVMIIGGSRIAIYLAHMLEEAGKNVVILEKSRKKCDVLFEHCSEATIINGDAGDYALLNEEGIDRMDAVVTLTDSDETNFLVSMYSESLNVPKNVTKINNLNLTKMLEKMGMDTYINVSEITCDMITQYVRAKKSVSSSSMKTLYKLVDGKIEASEFVADGDVTFLGKPLSSLDIKKDVLIAALHRKNKFIIPSGSDAIEQGDRVIIVSKASKIYELNDILS